MFIVSSSQITNTQSFFSTKIVICLNRLKKQRQRQHHHLHSHITGIKPTQRMQCSNHKTLINISQYPDSRLIHIIILVLVPVMGITFQTTATRIQLGTPMTQASAITMEQGTAVQAMGSPIHINLSLIKIKYKITTKSK